MCAALPTGCTLLASVGDSDCLLTVQKYNIGLTPEVSRVKKNAKRCTFDGNGAIWVLFFNNDTVNLCIFSVIMTTSLTFNTKKQNYADLPKVKHTKNLGNNDIFSKILVTKN